MFVISYRYRIYPSLEQEVRMVSWLETCRSVYNYALRERKDWIKSRSCLINACSLRSEYIIPVNAPYPGYYEQQNGLTTAKKQFPHLKDVQSQMIQEPIRRVEAAFAARKERGHGFPRFKKYGQYRSMLFPQFKTNPVLGNAIKLPKLGLMPIVLHRPIPDGFVVNPEAHLDPSLASGHRFARLVSSINSEQRLSRVVSRLISTPLDASRKRAVGCKPLRVVRKYSGWYAILCCQIDVEIPEVGPTPGHSIGIDVGLEVRFVG